MARKIKLVPLNLDVFTQYQSYRPQREPIEILAPKSFDLTTTKQASGGVGVLGNTLVGQGFYQERSYNFNWIGKKSEIDKIRFYLNQTSDEYFMFGGLSDNPIITPTVMYNTKAMLASLVDQYKPVNSRYEDYLPRYWFDSVSRRGSTGVRLGNYNSTLETQFGIIPTSARGASAYVYLEKGKSYSWILDPNYAQEVSENPHVTPFEISVVSLANNNNGGIIYNQATYTTGMNLITDVVDNLTHDAIMKITVVRPTTQNRLDYNNPQLFGILNYSAPLVTTKEITRDLGALESATANSFGEVPSLLTAVDDGVYNILSPSMAEFSCTFREVVYAVST